MSWPRPDPTSRMRWCCVVGVGVGGLVVAVGLEFVVVVVVVAVVAGEDGGRDLSKSSIRGYPGCWQSARCRKRHCVTIG